MRLPASGGSGAKQSKIKMKNMNKKISIISIAVIVIVGGGLYVLLAKNNTQVKDTIGENVTPNNNLDSKKSETIILSQPITFTDKGFSPQSQTIMINSSVIFINNTKIPLIIKYDDSSLPATLVLPQSTTKSPDFLKKGIYKYVSTDKPFLGGELKVE